MITPSRSLAAEEGERNGQKLGVRDPWKLFSMTGESRDCLNVHRNGLVEKEKLQKLEKEGTTDCVGQEGILNSSFFE